MGAFREKKLKIKDQSEEISLEIDQSELKLVSREEQQMKLSVITPEVPNLLAKRPQVDHIVGLVPDDTPQNRLQLMGGAVGFFEWMNKDKVVPDIKTMDQMLRIIPNTNEAEKQFLSLMEVLEIKPDINFYNQLIVLREQRQEYSLAKSTLNEMSENHISPDIMTFGSLARCCKDPKSAKLFLRDFENIGGRLNKEILTNLIGNMARALAPAVVEELLRVCMKHKIKPDKKMLHVVERFFQTYRKYILDKERGKYVPYPVVLELRENNLANWEKFAQFYKEWLSAVKPDLNEDPTLQYKTIKDEQNCNR